MQRPAPGSPAACHTWAAVHHKTSPTRVLRSPRPFERLPVQLAPGLPSDGFALVHYGRRCRRCTNKRKAQHGCGIELRSEVVGAKQVETPDKFHVCAATNPGCLFCPPPLFPKEKKNEKIEGTTVKLLATITPEGRADNVTVVKGLDKDLDMLAIKAVQGWRFSAARRNNLPIATRVQLEVPFRAF